MTNGEFYKGDHIFFYRRRLEILRDMLDQVRPSVFPGEPQWAVLKDSEAMTSRAMYRADQFEESIEDFARWVSADADTVLRLSMKTDILVTDNSGRTCILKKFGYSPSSNREYIILNRAVIQVPGDKALHSVSPADLKIAALPLDIWALVRDQVIAEMKAKESEKDLV